jgi:membrane protease YdiL (CAAX protease family)
MWKPLPIVVGLLLTLGVALLPLGTWGKRLLPGHALAGAEVLWWVAVGILLLYVTLVERRPLSSIGFRGFGWRSLLAGFATGILLVVGIIFIYTIVFPALHLRVNTGEMSRLLDTPFWYRFALVTRAAVAEETLFRGYPIPRLEELTGSTFAAALISWAAFTIAHLGSWGWAQLIVAGFGGILLAALFVWRRNLWINMVAHWIGDGAGFLLPH